MARAWIPEFESDMPSQAVSSPSPNSWWSRKVVRGRLVSAHAERMVVDVKVTEVARLGITDEGRRVLAEHRAGHRKRPIQKMFLRMLRPAAVD